MKKIFLFIFLVSLPAAAFGAVRSDEQNAGIAQAKGEYRIFLQELKKLNEQYREVTEEIKEVVKEEGVPVFDENTGEMKIEKVDLSEKRVSSGTAPAFADADVRETERDMIVTLDLPGMEKKNLNVRIENGNSLKITGRRESGPEHLRKDLNRTIQLPALADESKTSAEYENGVLTVTIRKSVQSKHEVSVPIR